MHPFFQLILLASISLVFSVAFTMLGMYLVRPLFGVTAIDTLTQAAMDNPNSIAGNANEVNALKFLQLMASIGTFLLPPILFGWMKFPQGDFLRLKVSTPFIFVILGILIITASAPFMDFVYSLNQAMRLPSFMSDLEQQIQKLEEQTDQFTQLFLRAPRPADLGINLIVMAIVPAIGEELMFRGCIQQVIREWTKNSHWAVWITAAIFSFIHFQFYGFVPRFLLGALLGYLFVWSGSLWITIIGHAFYNAAQIVLAYLQEHGYITNFDIVNSPNPWPSPVILIATVLCVALIYGYRLLVMKKRFIY